MGEASHRLCMRSARRVRIDCDTETVDAALSKKIFRAGHD